MSVWKEYCLGEVASFTTGKLNSNAATTDGRYPFYTCAPAPLYIDVAAFNQEAVILAGNNAEGNFAVNYYNGEFNAYQRTYVITARNNLNTKFLYYSLSQFLKDFKALSRGTATKFLTASILNSFKLSLPPIVIQQKIAAILSSLDEKIETNRKINARLEELAQALFKSWFIDFEPFGGQMPKDWEEDSIYRYVDVIYGAPYKSELFNDKGDGLPLIRIRDLKTNTPQVYTTEILPNTEYIDFGDIVVGMDAEFEPYFWFGSKGLLNQRVCKFKSKIPE